MLESPDWKREKIGDYRALSAIVAKLRQSIAEDPQIEKLRSIIKLASEDMAKHSKDREVTISEALQEREMIKMELLDHWDIDGKTYKCDMGSATLRSKKTLEISDQNALIALLFRLERLESAIRTLNTAYLKKLKDADMIPDALAYYDTKTNVAITEAKE